MASHEKHMSTQGDGRSATHSKINELMKNPMVQQALDQKDENIEEQMTQLLCHLNNFMLRNS